MQAVCPNAQIETVYSPREEGFSKQKPNVDHTKFSLPSTSSPFFLTQDNSARNISAPVILKASIVQQISSTTVNAQDFKLSHHISQYHNNQLKFRQRKSSQAQPSSRQTSQQPTPTTTNVTHLQDQPWHLRNKLKTASNLLNPPKFQQICPNFAIPTCQSSIPNKHNSKPSLV